MSETKTPRLTSRTAGASVTLAPILILTLVCASVAIPPASLADPADDPMVKELLALKAEHAFRGNPTVEKVRAREDRADVLKRAFEAADTKERRQHVIRVAEVVGTVSCETDTAVRTHGFLTAPDIVSLMVDFLDSDDKETRGAVTGALATLCPAEVIFPQGQRIVAAVKKHGNTDAIRLLGMAGCPEARKLLKEDARFRKCSERTTELALAKLGVPELEQKFIKEFLTDKDPEKKADLAGEVGYIATPGAVAALASQLRSPLLVPYRGHFQISMRVVVIESLSKAMPNNPLFWKPKEKPLGDGYSAPYPTSDEYYEPIEKWAEEVMQIKWDTPRPPFYYIGDRP